MDARRRNVNACWLMLVEIFPILCESPTSVEPSDRALDDPAFGQHGEARRLIGALDDLNFDRGQSLAHAGLELVALVAAIGIEFEQERKQAEQAGHQHDAALAVLDLGGMDDGLHQQSLRIDHDVPCLALDLLACIVARRVDRGPPFSVLFTL